MCYFLTIASPLTLSEVRSMLPTGLTAQPVGPLETAALRRLLPATQTVATLLVGACSCDLVRARHPESREDERHLRERYFRMRLTRDQIIRELERHRRGGRVTPPSTGWRDALVAFVFEHARNAGPTVYHLRFAPAGLPGTASAVRAVPRPLAHIRDSPDRWLEEDQPVLIVR